MSKTGKVQFNVSLPQEIVKAIKYLCTLQDLNESELAERAFSLYGSLEIAKLKKEGKKHD